MSQKARDFLVTRAQAYRKTFTGLFGERVLHDLAKFCRANETTYHSDPRLEGILQGRREVWLRISQHMNLTQDELLSHYKISKGE